MPFIGISPGRVSIATCKAVPIFALCWFSWSAGWCITYSVISGEVQFWLDDGFAVVSMLAPALLSTTAIACFMRKSAWTRRLSMRVGCTIALLSVAGTVALHFAFAPPRYSFLRAQTVSLAPNPGTIGWSWWVYCFRAKYQDVCDAAESELLPKGFVRVSHRLKSRKEFQLLGNDGMERENISISPERTTGTYYQYDGDFLETSPEPGWVTVSVTKDHPMPWGLLKRLAP